MTSWARPIEDLLGRPLTGRLDRAALQRLVDRDTAAGPQLVFRRSRYDLAEGAPGAAELARDVCALANRHGGLVVVGMADVGGVASGLQPLARLGDADVAAVNGAIGAWCAPPAHLDVVVVPDAVYDSGFEAGYLLLVVPPSPRRPHAVAPPGESTLSWPRRQGTEVVWLTEPEVAEAYRSRTARQADDDARMRHLVADAVARLDPAALWLVTAVVPEARGRAAPVDRALVGDYHHWLVDAAPRRGMRGTPLVPRGPAHAAPRRIQLGDGGDPDGRVAGTYLELHTDGAGLAAHRLWQPAPHAVHPRHSLPDDTRLITEEVVAELVAGALDLLCHHAVDHGDGWGDATAVTVVTDGGAARLSGPVVVCRSRTIYGLEPLPGTRAVDGPAPRTTATVDPRAIAGRRRALLQAVRVLGGALLHPFGWPELSQLTPAGEVRIEAFSPSTQLIVARWASAPLRRRTQPRAH